MDIEQETGRGSSSSGSGSPHTPRSPKEPPANDSILAFFHQLTGTFWKPLSQQYIRINTLDFSYLHYREEAITVSSEKTFFRDFTRNSLKPTQHLMKRKPFRMPQIDILEAKAHENLNQQMHLHSKYPESKLLCKKVIFPDEFSPPKLMIPYAHHKKNHPHHSPTRKLAKTT